MSKMKLLFASAGILLLTNLPTLAQGPLAFLHAGDSIVFQGDSITDGGRQKTGQDYNHIMGQDYAYILAAQIGYQSPERNLIFINRGVGGDWVSDLVVRWPEDTIALRPALLSILVGVNDTLSTRKSPETSEEFESIYDRLLAQTIAALPSTRIVLGEPFVLPVGKHVETYAKDRVEIEKRQQAVARLAAKYHLPLIHYQKAFDEACKKAPANHWSWDGIHPTYAGHGLMAREWLKTVDESWKRKGSS
jgi:lysophospholipase L1-like esterase